MTFSPAFESFWQAYKCQRRVKKLEAWGQWQLQGCESQAVDVMEGLARFKRTEQWASGYQPEVARWLKHNRWTDEPVEQDEAPAADGWGVTGPPK